MRQTAPPAYIKPKARLNRRLLKAFAIRVALDHLLGHGESSSVEASACLPSGITACDPHSAAYMLLWKRHVFDLRLAFRAV